MKKNEDGRCDATTIQNVQYDIVCGLGGGVLGTRIVTSAITVATAHYSFKHLDISMLGKYQ